MQLTMSFARPRWRPVLGVTVGAVLIGLAPVVPAAADPSGHTWQRLRTCESSDNYSIDTGNGYYGAYQFDESTWRSVGGTGRASDAIPGEQDARALILYRLRGWQPWSCASILGLAEDKDARSGRIDDIVVPTRSGSAPAWPGGSHGYRRGDDSDDILRWKVQMRTRGARLHGNGHFGRTTLKVVERIQRQNGLPETGVLGPVTWALAWTGDFRPSAPPAPPAPNPSPPPGNVGPVSSAPPMPGPHWFVRGDDSKVIQKWQRRMRKRGSTIHVNGHFGRKTLRVVKRVQRRNGRDQTGILGPVTWALAWTGKY